ncbi:uncharacterized protein CCOS01_14062 [Colletotrichum costaricense]|uniref:Protein kinase domain-containing protein n=1 Tax=Colletotrichum costaricense TaxID=1209916 RepID=A0AAJ0DUN8_9PEZI|nr:uncharacterized protein CCOS01_14062 [Colletotrichum costaricense]KAK1514122.1 hypothetical protein CCOS01_14062 [Colletotrichum costaricense]
MTTEYIFLFQSKIIAARGSPAFLREVPSLYENVLELQLPDCIVNEAFLPKNVILKIEYPKDRDLFDPPKTALFENEALIYDRLQPLQGSVIPRYLGLAGIAGRRAHLLSDIGGMSMIKKELLRTDPATNFEEMISVSLCLIRQHGVRLEYLDPSNVHLCGDALYIVDLEHAQLIPSDLSHEEEEEEEDRLREQVRHFVDNIQARRDLEKKMIELHRHPPWRFKSPRPKKRKEATKGKKFDKLREVTGGHGVVVERPNLRRASGSSSDIIVDD